MTSPIAALVKGQHLVCLSCADGYDEGAAVYAVNVQCYIARCHDCEVVIMGGNFGVELFPGGRICRICVDAGEVVYA